ncbi:ABC transporter ATP-binding protein [Anoxybacillus ayderensis]|uniref:ABC transporter ATP-binding protein n=1 Tax=Anoxybacillus sp. ST70 TaxID=2864180 RepID=UPI0002DB5817|nr:ABC transporter ATP-binding protein [Anoxybacillus sp. ST70]AXM90175.1 ABC transporter ATP-binding protein [Anoxybacillus ayderensis G10]MBW9218889.1 ABC transporter ATP-binding protein [Anoxybacillus sp. ST70]THD17641.1 ABC transporter ATP-binding protein [Anoxybacillus ayderensis]
MSLLHIDHLSVSIGEKRILNEVNIKVKRGEWFTLIGESGSGKSMTASAIIGLLPSFGRIEGGNIFFENRDVTKFSINEWRKTRGKEIAYIFQDYYSSFTPFLKIGRQCDEIIHTHYTLSKKERRDLIIEAFTNVDLPSERVYNSYPFQLSGGQLQRIAIAIAVLLRPKLLVADEPTSSLDMVTASRVLELIEKVRKETKCAVFFITHDIRYAKKYSDTIGVMKDGEIVEQGNKAEVIHSPRCEYTKSLFHAAPILTRPTLTC